MTCKPKKSKKRALRKDFTLEGLEEKGRLKFFYHSPDSKLPVRDIGSGKTEPHLEMNAENWCEECHQPDTIVPFLKSKEKYLFLFTKCRNNELPIGYCGEFSIIGYIIKSKKSAVNRGRHWAMQGKIRIFSFKDAYYLEKVSENPRHYPKLKTTQETLQILHHFQGKHNILRDCVNEIKRLKGINWKKAQSYCN